MGGLSCLYINVRSIRKKFKLDYISLYVKEYNYPDLLVLSETWLYENETKFYAILNYEAYHNCRQTRGGGVSLYIRKNIEHDELIITVPDKVNAVGIKLKDINCSIYGIYRAPKNNLKLFENFLEQLVYDNKKIIIIGDINLNLLENSRQLDNYKDILYMNNCVLQNIKNNLKFTRKTSVITGTVIDHIITSNQINCKMKTIDVPISDHKMIHCSFKTPKTNTKNRQVRTYRYIDHNKLNKYLKDRLGGIEDFSDLMEIIKRGKQICTSTKHMKIIENKTGSVKEF